MSVQNKVRAEYLELWNQVLASVHSDSPRLVDSGSVTQSVKIDMDVLDSITKQSDTVVEMRKELKQLDDEYAEQLSALGKAQDETKTSVHEEDERVARIADFSQGLVMSLDADVEKSSDLKHILQQIYLFQTSNQTHN